MVFLRAYLVVVLVGLTAYTLMVGMTHGWNLLPVFFASIAEMTWSGQFNLDFITFLGLSGIWVVWRHQCTGGAIALGILAFFGGMMFLAPYLLWASVQARGDAKVILMGEGRCLEGA